MPALLPCVGNLHRSIALYCGQRGTFMRDTHKSESNLAAKVESLIKPSIEALGLNLWDVRYEKEGGEWFLRVFIDRDTPLDTDTCELASRTIDPILDEADPIPQSYYLEVGSPGLGRRLTRPQHFMQMLGRKVHLKLYAPDENGNKEYTGTLSNFSNNAVILQAENSILTLDMQKLALVKLSDDDALMI